MNHRSILELFDQSVEDFRSHVAIESLDGGVTYGELADRSNSLANFLISQGVASGSIIAILAADASEVITAIIAVLKAGCAFMPLEPRMPEKRLQAMVAEVSPAWWIVEPKLITRLEKIQAGVTIETGFVCVNGKGVYAHCESFACTDQKLIPRDTQRPSITLSPEDICYLYFTSGSTGKPKGIAGCRKGIDHFVHWEIKTLNVTEETRVSQLTGVSFDASLRDVFVPLCAGGTICIPGARESIMDAARLIDWLDSRRINILHCVPTVFRSIVNERLRPEYFAALKYVLMAGEPLLPADVKKWMDVYGERVQLINLYGPTETTMTKFFYFVKPSDQEKRFVPIGKPMEGARALVINAKGRACPPGVVGEIYIRTPFRTLGYYNQPELTAEVFVQNPFSDNPNDIVYRTGDLGRILEDGNFEFLGRKDLQVKIRGVRVELAEVEGDLLKHELIENVAVIDREDSRGDKYLCAYIVASREVDPEELRSFLLGRLPEYMIPAVFVPLDELPMTLSGKVDRRMLPDPELPKTGEIFVPPRTLVEKQLADIWSRVLNVKQVGINDNFFALRGHSLLAARLLSLVREAFEVEIPLRYLFDAPTIAALAANIELARRDGAVPEFSSINSVPRESPLPLSFAQQRLWFLDQLAPQSNSYNIPAALRLRGILLVNVLQETLKEIISRHEVLRTHFAVVAGEAVQVVSPAAAVPIPLADLSELREVEREAEVKRLAHEEAGQAFNLSTGPLLRARLVRVSASEHVLLFTMHHIVSDGWSMGVLVREVSALYEAFSKNQPSPLAALPIQYADYAVWQRKQLQGAALEEQLSYWRRELEKAPQVLELPTDRARPPVQNQRGGLETFLLDRELTAQLKQLSLGEGVTLFMTLLAGFQTLLYRYSGQRDILVGTPIANRTRRETEELIGFFVNTLVMRGQLNGEMSFRKLLQQTRETTLGAYAHQEVPFERLVEELRPERSLSHAPLFQVWFVLDDLQTVPLKLRDLTLSWIKTDSGTTQFDLVLSMYEVDGRLGGTLRFNSDLFEVETVALMLEAFRHLLAEVTARPEYCLVDVPLHQNEQSRRLSPTWEPQNLEQAEDQFAL